MKKQSKIAIATTAVLATGALGFALPSLAHDRNGDPASVENGQAFEMGDRKEHNQVELDARISSVPSDLTSPREIARGAYFEVYLLEADATAVPSQKPVEDGKRISLRPSISDDGTVSEPTFDAGALTGELGLRAPQAEGVTKLALFPSDGGAAVLVTITVDAAGEVTATTSGELTVAYSAEVAANTPEHSGRMGREMRQDADHDHHGPGHHHGGPKSQTQPNA